MCLELPTSSSGGGIPLVEPEIRGKEWEYIKECLDTGWVSTAGSFVSHFEEQLASYLGVKYAVAVSSGTAALHVALMTAGVQADDEVIVSTLTFVAPANAIRYIGAWPVFMDADPHYWQLDVEKLSDFLQRECKWVSGELRNKTSGRRIKAVLPVSILGHPVDLDSIFRLACEYGKGPVI